MAQITGKAIIRVDGEELRTLPGAKLNPGGVNREAVKGAGKVHGYKEEEVEPSMECQVAHTRDLSLKRLADITAATVMFETDTGRQFILREAWTSEPPALDSGAGTVDLKMSAISCDEA